MHSPSYLPSEMKKRERNERLCDYRCKLSVGLLSGRYSRPPSDESANEGATEDNKQPNVSGNP